MGFTKVKGVKVSRRGGTPLRAKMVLRGAAMITGAGGIFSHREHRGKKSRIKLYKMVRHQRLMYKKLKAEVAAHDDKD